jgi:hypothetical protein
LQLSALPRLAVLNEVTSSRKTLIMLSSSRLSCGEVSLAEVTLNAFGDLILDEAGAVVVIYTGDLAGIGECRT